MYCFLLIHRWIDYALAGLIGMFDMLAELLIDPGINGWLMYVLVSIDRSCVLVGVVA